MTQIDQLVLSNLLLIQDFHKTFSPVVLWFTTKQGIRPPPGMPQHGTLCERGQELVLEDCYQERGQGAAALLRQQYSCQVNPRMECLGRETFSTDYLLSPLFWGPYYWPPPVWYNTWLVERPSLIGARVWGLLKVWLISGGTLRGDKKSLKGISHFLNNKMKILILAC